ncbi:MAG: cytochrome C [Euryarchaeota archaeon]|nr:cytochrome C [Euryarchaeota archaeon]
MGKIRRYSLLIGTALLLFLVPSASALEDPTTCDDAGCHQGIEPIMEEGAIMLAAIQAKGGCVVCHGGNPKAKTKGEAHTGAPADLPAETFYRDPGSIWIVDKTCGQAGCHPEKPYTLMRSLMQTEAGKIQGNEWAWGAFKNAKDRTPLYGNYDLDDPDGPVPLVGSDAYKAYIKKLIDDPDVPNLFAVDRLKQLPYFTPEEVEKQPNLAAYTYARHDCQRCHVGVRGKEARGDYRGMGCSACHILYSNEGFYEGNDPTIPKDQPGHLLKHRIYGTREAGKGIPVEACNSCHNRGKRIGVTYQGLMEFEYGSPFTKDGGTEPDLHGKKYLFIKEDLHHEMESRPENPRGRMLCQDCHTSIDIHGDGNIFGTTLAQVEIECADCHGTPDKYPWELPLGYGEEFAKGIGDRPRGTTDTLLDFQALATFYAKEDGYLLTARGNPFGDVVRRGEKVIVHSATGVDFEVPVLKTLKKENKWKSPDASVAMDKVSKHMDKMECYSCHADWAPQCYGCHVTVDYSKDSKGTDWIFTGNERTPSGETADAPLGKADRSLKSPGKISETRSYLRWEEPILGINGEGRVTPLIPGCQVTFTVIGKDGQTLEHNKQAIGPDGIRGMDMAPVQPHSAARDARSCESCHNSEKALGYGIQGGRYQLKSTEDYVVDLEDENGKIIPEKRQVQIAKIPGMDFDWSQIVTRDGKQLQTVGSHWGRLEGPLPKEMRDSMERTGVCMGCHQLMDQADIWDAISTPGVLSDEEHIEHMKRLALTYAERGVPRRGVCGPTALLALAVLPMGLWALRRRRY